MWSTLSQTSKKRTASTPKSITQTKMQYAISASSSFGHVFVGMINSHIRLIALASSPKDLLNEIKLDHPIYDLVPAAKLLQTHIDALIQHLEDPSTPTPKLPTKNIGTPFQHKVWDAISSIPIGSTRTYAQLAEDIGQPKAVRAVAQACGKNGLAVLVPCHRVVGSGGSLGGYRWGVERKKRLLEMEKKLASRGAAKDVSMGQRYTTATAT